MNLVVCLKRVPDTTFRPQVGPDGRSINPQGVEWVMNPYDEFAVEEALRIKEKAGAGEVIVVSLDPDGNDSILRKALAMGADRAVLVKGGSTFDGAAVAEVLAGALKGLDATIILFGKQAVDSDSSQVPSLVAHHLGLARANVVTKMEVQGGKVVARRQVEGAEEVVELSTPCVVSAQKGLNEPRYPSLKGIMAAKKKPVEELVLSSLGIEAQPTTQYGNFALPPARSGQTKFVESVEDLVQKLRTEAKAL